MYNNKTILCVNRLRQGFYSEGYGIELHRRIIYRPTVPNRNNQSKNPPFTHHNQLLINPLAYTLEAYTLCACHSNFGIVI